MSKSCFWTIRCGLYSFWSEDKICSELDLGRPREYDVSALNVLTSTVPALGDISLDPKSYWHRLLTHRPSEVEPAFDSDFNEHYPDEVRTAIRNFLASLDKIHREHNLVAFSIGEGEFTVIAEHSIMDEIAFGVITMIYTIENAIIDALDETTETM